MENKDLNSAKPGEILFNGFTPIYDELLLSIGKLINSRMQNKVDNKDEELLYIELIQFYTNAVDQTIKHPYNENKDYNVLIDLYNKVLSYKQKNEKYDIYEIAKSLYLERNNKLDEVQKHL